MKKERERLSARIIRPEKLLRYGKMLVFFSLLVVCIIVAVVNRNATPGYALYAIIATEAALLIENAIKMWSVTKRSGKIVCYVLDTLLLLVLTFFTNGSLISTLYVIILSEFYLTQRDLSGNIVMGACSVVLFLVMTGVSASFHKESIDIWGLVTNSVNDLLIFVLHFLILNFTLVIYRKNNEIESTLSELNESNAKLKAAYSELQTVTVLEERQRIAREIHDTAGHSITTVIMQTEAARLVIEKDPEDAKRKIMSANLQAKHALEELRESVHLLSGAQKRNSLREELVQILHESSDGTDVSVRYEIDDITLCDAKARFVLNTLKEGISNGLRHGGATAFWFSLTERGGIVNFLLSDNGKGMLLSDLKEGFGLTGMHRRAAGLGGTVWFETEPGEGFEIHMTLPSDPNPESGDNKKGDSKKEEKS